jgi:hypothetical protein
MKQKLQLLFIVVGLIILAIEIKMLHDRLHPPTTAPSDLVYNLETLPSWN